MQLFREQNIVLLARALDLDQYDDAAQDQAFELDEITPAGHAFLKLYWPAGRVLEIGCGSGSLFGRFRISDAVEPAVQRFEAARRAGKKHEVDVRQAVAEALPYSDREFSGVLMLNGFFQVRSDYEALIEINRVLIRGGVFLFNLVTNDEVDVVQGRCFGPRNMRRTLSQFGFDTLALLECAAGPRFEPFLQRTAYFCAEKHSDFTPEMLNLPQVLGDIKNYLPSRDWKLR